MGKDGFLKSGDYGREEETPTVSAPSSAASCASSSSLLKKDEALSRVVLPRVELAERFWNCFY